MAGLGAEYLADKPTQAADKIFELKCGVYQTIDTVYRRDQRLILSRMG